MAEAIISTIIGDAVSRAVSVIVGRFSNQESTEDKLEKISHMLIRIHSVVEEAKGRQISNHGTLQWLSELINSEYLGYYLLDSIRCSEHEAEQGDDKVFPQPQVFTLSLFNPAKRVRVAGCTIRSAFSWCRDHGADEIDRVLEKLRGMSLDLREFIMLLQNCPPVRRPLATNIFRDGQMFGRHVEKERIINFLLHLQDDHSTGELGVLPIVGANGVGKTTLMQHACDDARVRNHFPVIMVYDFSYTYVVRKSEGTPDDPLELLKRNSFCDTRFLMVFEDVDTNRNQILEEILRSLRCVREGSKVIITTNNRRVANIIGTVEPIIITALPCPEYWFFFKEHAFAGRDIEDNPSLIAAGKQIARKLNGSFFGAKIIGGVLRDHPDQKFWCKVLRNIGGMYPHADGIGYISDLAEKLLPGHVDMCKVTISKDPFPPQTTELARLKDLCAAAPHISKIACWTDDVRLAKLLLCKSVLPFFNHYYIARCSCNCTVASPDSYSKLVLSFLPFAKNTVRAEGHVHAGTLMPMSIRKHILPTQMPPKD